MAGVSVGRYFFAFDCEEIDLAYANWEHCELLPILECFSRGQFVGLKTLRLVMLLLYTPRRDASSF